MNELDRKNILVNKNQKISRKKFIKNYILDICKISPTDRTGKEICILNYFIGLVEEKVNLNIKKRQDKIDGLFTKYNGGVFGGELTPGCDNCINRGLNRIRSTSRCNLECKFCCYVGILNRNILSPLHYLVYSYKDQLNVTHEIPLNEEEVIQIFEKRKDIKAINWLAAGEPFMDFKKIPRISKRLTELGIHQHINTNGVLLTEDMMKTLHDCGLSEIRFNLAATNFSQDVIKSMKIARKYFKYLCIEVPMFKEVFDGFIKNKKEILNCGVDHINLDEVHFETETSLNNFSNEILYISNFRRVSPISSRQYSYDLIEISIDEKWNIVMNECCNNRKFYCGIKNSLPPGTIDYAKTINPPLFLFIKNLDKLTCEEEDKILFLIEDLNKIK